jgi:homopolymeric O-antigen transport system ATP-binding protein
VTSAITVRGVSKRFQQYPPQRPATLHEALTHGFGRLRPSMTFWALRDINLEVPRGASMGLVGSNGAGKSTLLRLIAQVGRPDTGTIDVHGRARALLDLGTGFHPDLTGRENVMLGGVISGLTKREVKDRFEEIVAFSELEPFIDNPLRTFSTGMRLRLSFAVAALAEPEVLLVDEVLVVGDLAFQHKCVRRIEQLKAKGCTLLLCTQDVALIRDLCGSAVWLDKGRIVASGEAQSVVDGYVRASDGNG